MTMRLALTIAVCAMLVSANAEQVHFTGHTRANEILIHDVMKNIALVGSARFKCDSPDAVESEILPDDFSVPDAQQAAGGAKVQYERWKVSLCGRVEPFVVGYWASPSGGMMFLVSQGNLNNGPSSLLVIEDPEIHRTRVAAESGDPKAQFAMGLAYQHGSSVPVDYAQAADWYAKAAAAGHVAAEDRLGELYERGAGVEKDLAKAAALFRKAAEGGDPVGQLDLGTAYVNGSGVPQDYSQALAWYQKSAAQGNPKAQYDIGAMYMKGVGVAKDYAVALQWFRKSAAAGEARGQFALGYMYQMGWGVERDYAQAMAWYEKAAAQGDDIAIQYLALLKASGH
jgi:TPR repeat protein